VLVTADGDAQTGGDIAARVHVVVPDLAPLAGIGKIDLQGRTDAVATLAMHHGDSDVGVTGTADFTGGQAPVPTLLGPTSFAVSATLAGQDITIHDARVDGRAVHADVTGTDRVSGLDLAWRVALTDLSKAAPQIVGALNATGHVGGATSNLAVTADVTGEAGSGKFPKAPVTLALRADHLPGAPQATLQGAFRVAGAPARLEANVTTDAAGLHVLLKRADWKSLLARADLVLPKGQTIPVGTASIDIRQIADAASLAGQDVTGSLNVKLTSSAREARIEARGSDLAAGARRIAALTLTGGATGIETDPDLRAQLNLDGIATNGITGRASIDAAGRQTALQLHARADLQNVAGAPADLQTSVLLNAKQKQAVLQSLVADWKTLAIRLAGPSRIDFGAKTAVDHLRLAVNQAQLDVAGQIAPSLALTASLRNVTPDLAKAIAPDLRAAGVLTADARLTGTTAAPFGTVHLSAAGLQLRQGPAAAIPPAAIAATIRLNGGSAGVDARVDAGPKLHLAANGTAPLNATGALNLRARGSVDLMLLDPVLQASGRQARGMAALDVTVGGTAQAPRIGGTVSLAHGEIQDFAQGVHLTGITARIDAAGDTFRILQFTADAAPGTISVTGTVGALAPNLPVDLRITARQAKPLASDLLTAQFDADLTVRGNAAGEMRAAGKILLHRVEINIPDSLPPSVAVLNVRRPGDKPPVVSASAPSSVVRLAITVDAPRNIFVRGHGLDSELSGTLQVDGTSAAPQISGGFDMRRGDFSLAGTTLNFSKGNVSFNGAGLAGKIDPTLNFEADSDQGGITATLKVTGYADAPKIALSSVPDLPQDEVLAHLLFGESMKQLSPLQIAEIGAALAELSGATGGGGGPLNSIRKGLGLDRLNVGGGTNGAGASVEAGRYVANGVYVGAKQSTSGAGGTQAQVQVDLTRHLKLQTTLGTGGGTAQGATPDNDPGSSVGLSYQFEY
jgi:translocation and assembly module TamB